MRTATEILVVITLVFLSFYIRKQKAKIEALKRAVHTLTLANAKLWNMVDDHVS